MKYELVILGSGESGTGAAILAKQKGLQVFVSDKGAIPENYKIELQQYQIPYEELQHTNSIILQASEIVKSPGIPEKSDIIQQVRQAGIPVISEVELAFRYKGNSKILAITGSNGKTTTTSLTYAMFVHENLNAAVVGNIGFSFARQVALDPRLWYVMEISSFQLDDIVDFRPDIAVILNITPDHLDRYQYDFARYVNAKFNISRNQTPDDYLILCLDNQAINEYLLSYTPLSKRLYFTMNESLHENGAYINGQEMVIRVNGEPFTISINDLSLKGKHNLYNSMAAGISARVAEIRDQSIRECLKTFTAIEHRMEHVATIRGVEFINDSKATNLNSVWYALESMTRPTVLILGGVDKGNNYEEIRELVQEKVKGIICMGVDNKAIKNFFKDIVPLTETHSVEEAVKAAYEMAVPGDCVLLSPACASFDLFKNYEDRGSQFKQVVKAL